MKAQKVHVAYPQLSKNSTLKKYVAPITAATIAILILAVSVLSTAQVFRPVKQAEAVDWVKFAMCEVLPKPAPTIYQFANSDDLEFTFRSKSVSSGGMVNIDSTLNNLIAIGTDNDFVETNKTILGYDFTSEPGVKERADLGGGDTSRESIGGGDVVIPADGKFTSGYGTRWGTIHKGVDIANPIGTPIYAAMDGEVIDSGPATGYGRWIRLKHPDGSITVYGHNSKNDVQVGDTVKAGDKIGEIGNEGGSTGPHLHFEIWPDGQTASDPGEWFRESGIDFPESSDGYPEVKAGDGTGTAPSNGSSGASEERKQRRLEEIKRLSGEEYTAAENAGPKVTPYDRFGVAGLVFTNYIGEWKYLVVEACADGGEPKDPQAELMYIGRLIPKDTWENRGNSKDPRVIQSTRGLATQVGSSALNVVANLIFGITKFIVALTLGIINLSFSDVPKILGLNEIIGGDGGIFNSLFQGVFSPLVSLLFLITAGKMFYSGIVKRQYRKSFNDLLYSLGAFLAALVVSVIPMQIVSLPNDIATVGQAVVISSIGGDMKNTKGMCSTVNYQDETQIVSTNGATDDTSILEEANKNIRSTIGCQFWEAFLLRPWSEAQFGVNYDKLWVKGMEKSIELTENSETINNDNEHYVGKASVPLGGNYMMHNWAILQISTLTDAHAAIRSEEKQVGRYVNNVNTDWWRIVDAFSNYDEENKITSVEAGGTAPQIIQHDAQKTDNLQSDYWGQWVGNNNFTRIGIASSSVLVAIVGVGAPLAIATLSASYSVAIAFMMSFMPIFLLLSIWGGRGREMFMSWFNLVINTVLKRIAIGMVLVLTLVGITTLISLGEELGYWTMLFGIILVSILMWRAKDEIFAIFASFGFGQSGLQGVSDRVGAETKKIRKMTVNAPLNVATSVTGATIGAKRNGGTLREGFADGIKYEARNIAWRTEAFRPALTQYDITSRQKGKGESIENEKCIACGINLGYASDGKFRGGILESGQYLCERCYNDNVEPEAAPVMLNENKMKEIEKMSKMKWNEKKTYKKNEKSYKLHELHQKAYGNLKLKNNRFKELSNSLNNAALGKVIKDEEGNIIGRQALSNKELQTELHNIATNSRVQLNDYEKKMRDKKFGENVEFPNIDIPKELDIDREAAIEALQDEDYETFAELYANSIISYIRTNRNLENLDTNIDQQTLINELLPQSVRDKANKN